MWQSNIRHKNASRGQVLREGTRLKVRYTKHTKMHTVVIVVNMRERERERESVYNTFQKEKMNSTNAFQQMSSLSP